MAKVSFNNKLTKSAAIAAAVEGKIYFAKDGSGNAEGIVLNGQSYAEPNKLEGVQVNGTDLAVSGKKVNVTVATGSNNGNIAVNGVDVPVKGLKSAAFQESSAFDASGAAAAVQGNTSSTVKDAMDAIAESAGDITELEGKVDGIDTRLGTAESDIDSLESGKADKASTLAGYGIEDAYTKTEIDAKVAGVFKFKGTATTVSSDRTTISGGDAGAGVVAAEANNGWVYQIDEKEYVSNGSVWELLGFVIDLSNYDTKAEVDAKIVAAKTVILGEANYAHTVKEAYELAEQAVASAGVTKFGGQTGEITLDNGKSGNGDINLTMDGKKLKAAIVGLGTAAFANVASLNATAQEYADIAKAEAESYAEGLDGAMDARVKVFEANGAHDVAALEGRVTTAEGAISANTSAISQEATTARAAESANAAAAAAAQSAADAAQADATLALGYLTWDE